MSGPAVFETMAVRGGRLPLLDAHLGRLRETVAALRLPRLPDGLGDEAADRARRGGDRLLRIAWSAAGLRWSERPLDGPERWRLRTVGVPHPGYPFKTEDRDAFDRALIEARGMGADEALLRTSTGTVVEAARFAVVWVEGSELCHPDPELGGLPSIGLARLRDVAEASRIPRRAAWIDATALARWPVGLVNAGRGLVPVASLDGEPTGQSEVLETLAAGFWPAA